MNSIRYFVIYTKPVPILLRWTKYLLYCKLYIFKLKLEFVINILGFSELKIDQMYKRQKFLKKFSKHFLKSYWKFTENFLICFAKLSQICLKFSQILNKFFQIFKNILQIFLKLFQNILKFLWELTKTF